MFVFHVYSTKCGKDTPWIPSYCILPHLVVDIIANYEF